MPFKVFCDSTTQGHRVTPHKMHFHFLGHGESFHICKYNYVHYLNIHIAFKYNVSGSYYSVQFGHHTAVPFFSSNDLSSPHEKHLYYIPSSTVALIHAEILFKAVVLNMLGPLTLVGVRSKQQLSRVTKAWSSFSWARRRSSGRWRGGGRLNLHFLISGTLGLVHSEEMPKCRPPWSALLLMHSQYHHFKNSTWT